MQTSAGPVAATVTIGGLTVPRHARTVSETLTRAQDALYGAGPGAAARSRPTNPI